MISRKVTEEAILKRFLLQVFCNMLPPSLYPKCFTDSLAQNVFRPLQKLLGTQHPDAWNLDSLDYQRYVRRLFCPRRCQCIVRNTDTLVWSWWDEIGRAHLPLLGELDNSLAVPILVSEGGEAELSKVIFFTLHIWHSKVHQSIISLPFLGSIAWCGIFWYLGKSVIVDRAFFHTHLEEQIQPFLGIEYFSQVMYLDYKCVPEHLDKVGLLNWVLHRVSDQSRSCRVFQH